MGFYGFLKEIFLDGKRGLFGLRADEQDLPSGLRESMEEKNALANVKRIVPFSIVIFLIEILNQLTILITDACPELRPVYLAAGAGMLLLTGCAVFLAYRVLSGQNPSIRRCQFFYRAFWALFSAGMLVFICLELLSRGQTNNFFYLLILTAAFPLLCWKEAAWLFAVDILAVFPMAISRGYSAQQLLQLPLVAFFAWILSRMLYHGHHINDVMVLRLEISNQKLASLASTDPLTGLLNRRGVQEQLQEALPQLKGPEHVAFLMVDIDLFKNYNDCFGHEQGDRCLQKVAEAVKGCTRSQTDFAARFGGEEFLVVLVGCEHTDVLQIAQRLRWEVKNLRLKSAPGSVCDYVTVSVGVAETKTPFDFTNLYERADRALYRAKNAGRNCVAAEDGVCGGDAF